MPHQFGILTCWKKTLAYLLVLPGSRARIVRCGGRYDPQLVKHASPICDPYLQRDIDSLEHIQRKAARFTTRDFRQRSSVTAMMHDLQWEPLAKEN